MEMLDRQTDLGGVESASIFAETTGPRKVEKQLSARAVLQDEIQFPDQLILSLVTYKNCENMIHPA